MKKTIIAALLISVGFCPLLANGQTSGVVRNSSENSTDSPEFVIVNELDKFRIEFPKVEQKDNFALLSLQVKRINTTRVPFGSHVHIDAFDQDEELIKSILQYIRHRHSFSRYLRHKHRTMFVPERVPANLSSISKMIITSHLGHQELK
jgi:hypothetical protein